MHQVFTLKKKKISYGTEVLLIIKLCGLWKQDTYKNNLSHPGTWWKQSHSTSNVTVIFQLGVLMGH